MKGVRLPVMPPVSPMLAKPVAVWPDDCSYEPKWDGFRSIVFRDGDEIEIGSRNERPMTRYFPELVRALAAVLPPRCVVDGEIILVRDGRLDFAALQLRLHPAASRINLLAEQTPAAFVGFDMLALDDEDLTAMPFRQRRSTLERVLADSRPPVFVTPATSDQTLARQWFTDFEGAGLDGIIAKPLDGVYEPDRRTMFKLKHQHTVDCVVAGYRSHKTDPQAIGSLLLGLYKDDGNLASVGVIGAFPMAERKRLYNELQPLVTTFDQHPWNWAAMDLTRAQQAQWSAGSRWNPGKDLSFTPLRPERVVEASYDYLEGERFRHTAQFRRWRPDRDANSCTFDQLQRPLTSTLDTVLQGI